MFYAALHQSIQQCRESGAFSEPPIICLKPSRHVLSPLSPNLLFLCVLAVCPGTQNGLSSTGSQENQYNLTKDRYNGCEIIMGNLEIAQIENDWDFSFLKVKP